MILILFLLEVVIRIFIVGSIINSVEIVIRWRLFPIVSIVGVKMEMSVINVNWKHVRAEERTSEGIPLTGVSFAAQNEDVIVAQVQP